MQSHVAKKMGVGEGKSGPLVHPVPCFLSHGSALTHQRRAIQPLLAGSRGVTGKELLLFSPPFTGRDPLAAPPQYKPGESSTPRRHEEMAGLHLLGLRGSRSWTVPILGHREFITHFLPPEGSPTGPFRPVECASLPTPCSRFPACASVGETRRPFASGLSPYSPVQGSLGGLALWLLKATPLVEFGPALCVSHPLTCNEPTTVRGKEASGQIQGRCLRCPQTGQ